MAYKTTRGTAKGRHPPPSPHYLAPASELVRFRSRSGRVPQFWALRVRAGSQRLSVSVALDKDVAETELGISIESEAGRRWGKDNTEANM